ncbi:MULTISPECIES: NUDIX hydrolase [Legionella]|uniref:CoA pyrophosphatase n=1 Tax=Legionella septentrionalis TaxID=2498109 RepID=A0A433JJK5_9GAMM|nr:MULTISPECIES: CoA pyrophosphatase [Legionella]MCP0912864.1 CoA pyrophosphatase [Legionella sp. 27cVA30]RUQ88364.1 CoA pyrophosphatase [Legionella septentrionalis]RUQ95066.1 CoA pyrophosphatase [Legionella septentrionalis]
MLRIASVIVLQDEAAASLVLTKRSANLRMHPGEICFPGGLWEPQDQNLWITALRELQEELGIAASRVRLLKELPLERTLSGTAIHPWLGSISALEPYLINENEVSEVIFLPIQDVLNPKNYQEIEIARFGQRLTCCQYTASSEHFIWGATARIMKQLCLAGKGNF